MIEMHIRVDPRPKAPSAWRAMKHFEKRKLLAMFREDHLRAENRRQVRNQLHAVEGALHSRLTPEFRLKAEGERVRLNNYLQ